MNRYNKPRSIEAFAGMHIRKVACSGQSSLALTSTGQVRQRCFVKHTEDLLVSEVCYRQLQQQNYSNYFLGI